MDPVLHFATAADWEAWLAQNHASGEAVWLKIARKGSPVVTVTNDQAIEVAICHGWIDGQRKALDHDCYLQRFSHRRRESSWSRINVERAEALIAAGRVRPAGLAEITAAREDGRWDAAYVAQRNATVPPDLAEALAAHPEAAARFEALGKTDRYLLMMPVLKAVNPKTRATRVEKVIAGLRDRS